MPGLRDIPGDHAREGYFPGHLTIGTAKEVALFRAPFPCTVTAVEFIPSAALSGANTNSMTVNIYNRVAGAGSTVVAALAFVSGVDLVAQTPKAITLSATAANLILAEGDVVTCAKAVVGDGLACPDGTVIVHLKSS